MSAVLSAPKQDVVDMAFAIADEAARSDIECYCAELPRRVRSSPAWYDTSKLEVVEEADRGFIDEAVRYLDLRGLLIHHEDDAALVSFPQEPVPAPAITTQQEFPCPK